MCAACDRDDPDSQGVLAFFALHETVTDDTVASAAALIDEWAHRVDHRPSGNVQEESDEEFRRWLDGDL